MTLIRCRKCKHRYLDDAERCPTCNAKTTKPYAARIAAILAILVACMALAYVIYAINSEANQEDSPRPLMGAH